MKSRNIILLLPLAVSLTLTVREGLNQRNSISTDTTLFQIPVNFPPLGLTGIPLTTEAGFSLGKTLFYDARLSANRLVSCASCHQQSAAFANLNTAVSAGINDLKGSRNTPALFNLAWQQEFMWDGRLQRLELVPINALTSPTEMGNSMKNVIDFLKKDSIYGGLFERSFGSPEITQQRVLNALAQFTSMLISSNSRYDKLMRKQEGVLFSSEEKAGYLAFLTKCNGCHTAPLFTDRSYHNNGLDLKYSDRGRDSLTHDLRDLAKFKTPSLRNIEITGPYMHDGRFKTLKQVLEHYNSGMKDHVNLDSSFTHNGKPGISLSLRDQGNLIKFLKTLTDLEMINNRKFNMN